MAGWPGSWSIIKLIEYGKGAKLVLPPIMEAGHGDTTRQRRFDKAERTATRLGLEASLRPRGRPLLRVIGPKQLVFQEKR